MTEREQNFFKRFGQTIAEYKASEKAREERLYTEWAVLRGLGKEASK